MRLLFLSYRVLFNICFILVLFHFAFYFIVSTRYEKNFFCVKLMHMPCTTLEILPICRVISASVTKLEILFVIIGNKCCALSTITCTVHSGQFCFWHQTGKIVVSSNCHAPISNSTYMVIFASAALIAFFFFLSQWCTHLHTITGLTITWLKK